MRVPAFILHPFAFILDLGGCSSVGRASAFQAEGREFESRRPLQVYLNELSTSLLTGRETS